MIPNRFTLILISLTSSLIDAAHTSSEIASPRSRPTFTLGDEDLCDFLYPCTPHAIRPRPLRPPLDGAYGSTFFNRWPGLLLLCVACLLLGVVIGTVCPAWETRAQRATRASPLVDAHSSEINLTQVPVVDENSPQEAREAASTEPCPPRPAVPGERGSRGSSPPAIQFSPSREGRLLPLPENAAGPSVLDHQRLPKERRAAPIKSGSSSLSTNAAASLERAGGHFGAGYVENSHLYVSLGGQREGKPTVHHFQPESNYPGIRQVLEADTVLETNSTESFKFCEDNVPSCPAARMGLGRVLIRERDSHTMDEHIKGSDVDHQIRSMSLLFVGLPWGHDQTRTRLSGPTVDLDWFRQLFSMARDTATLYSLPGFSATHNTIRSAIWRMFQQSHLQSAIVLYFSGHSNDRDEFALYDGTFIQASTLVKWIIEIRKQTKHLPVWIVLDHCRPGPSPLPTPTIPGDDIYVLWACSPGQSSTDAELDNNLPFSNLLKALFLTMGDMLTSPDKLPNSLLECVNMRMAQLVRVNRGIACGKNECPIPWNDCPCPSCTSGGYCRHSVHSTLERPIQDVVGFFWGSEEVVDTARLLRRTRPILDRFGAQIGQIAQGIRQNKWFRKYNDPKEIERDPPPPAGPVARRGKSPHMAVASTPVSPLG